MTVYLLHFARPIGNPANPRGQAQHYIGFAEDDRLAERLAAHHTPAGAAIMRAVHAADIPWTLARTWPGASRTTERRLKRHKNARRLCPICRRSTT